MNHPIPDGLTPGEAKAVASMRRQQVDATRDCPCRDVDNLDEVLWAGVPVKVVYVEVLTLSQETLLIRAVLEADLGRPVRVVHHGDVFHLVNGHHRYVSAAVRGQAFLLAQVLER